MVEDDGVTTEEEADEDDGLLEYYGFPAPKLPARMLAEAREAAAGKPYDRSIFSFEGVGGKDGHGGGVQQAACFVCADEAKLARFAQEMESKKYDLIDILPESYGGNNIGGKDLFRKSLGYDFPALANPMLWRLVDRVRKQRGKPGFVALAIIGMLCGKGAEVLSVLGDPSNADLDSVKGIKAIIAAVRRVCPAAAECFEALNQRLVFCGRTGSGRAAPDASNPEGLFGARCAEQLSASEYRLLEIIVVGCANAGVLFGAIIPFGGPATATFHSLASLATRVGRARAGASSFECVVPETTAAHAKYFSYGGEPLASFIRVASDMLASCMAHVAKLNGIESCPPRTAFDERVYGALRTIRLELSAAATNGSLTEEDIPVFGASLSPAAAKESASKAARDNGNKLKRVYYDATGAAVASHTETGEDGDGNTLFPPPPTVPYVRVRTDRANVFGGELGGANGSTAGQHYGDGGVAGRQRADAARAALAQAVAQAPIAPVEAAALGGPMPLAAPPEPPPLGGLMPPVAPAAPRARPGDLMRMGPCKHGCSQSAPKEFKFGQWKCCKGRCNKTCNATLYCAQCGLGGAACARRNMGNAEPPCLSALHFRG